MASQSWLPNELVEKIVDNVELEDIESFTLVCKQWKECGLGRLEEHRALEKKYAHYHCDCAVNYLDELEKNPIMSVYMKKLTITYWNDGVYLWPPTYRTRKRMINAVARHNPALNFGVWNTLIREAYEDGIASLLLLTLPRLNILEIGRLGGSRYGYNRFLESFNCMTDPRPSTTVLEELHTVKIYAPPHSPHPTLDPISILARLPSLRTIRARNTYTSRSNMALGSSNVTTLDLKDCSVAPIAVPTLMASFKTLEVFSLRGGSAFNEPAELTIRFVRGALETYQRRTLKSLTLRSGSCFPLYMGSLRGLKVLSTLETEINLLLPLHAFDRLSYLHSSIIGALPESLEDLRLHINLRYRLRLHVGYKMTDHQLVSRIIDALAMAKGAGHLQKLERVTIITDSGDEVSWITKQPFVHRNLSRFSYRLPMLRCSGECISLDFELCTGEEQERGSVVKPRFLTWLDLGLRWLGV